MVTLGEILQHLDHEMQAGNEGAQAAIEEIVVALIELGGKLEDHVTTDGDVVDDWCYISNITPSPGDMIVVRRRFEEGNPRFTATFVGGDNDLGWECEANGRDFYRPVYDDDEWKRI